jgi:hypothetical protein
MNESFAPLEAKGQQLTAVTVAQPHSGYNF